MSSRVFIIGARVMLSRHIVVLSATLAVNRPSTPYCWSVIVFV